MNLAPRAANQLHALEPGGDAAREVLEALLHLAGEGGTVSRRDVHRAMRGRRAFALAQDFEGPLRLLEEYGWIQRIRDQGSGPGRPSETITLNPLGQLDKMDRTPNSAGSVHFVPPSIDLLTDEMKADPNGVELLPTGTDGVWREEL